MKHLLPGFCLLTFLSLLPSCGEDFPCGDPDEVPQNARLSINFIVPNTNDQENLLGIIEYPCQRDSIKVFQEDGETAIDFSLGNNGSIFFKVNTFQQDHSRAFVEEVIKRFQLYINYREVHDIEFRYMISETNCNHDVFTYIETWFDGELFRREEDVPDINSVIIEQTSLGFNPC